MPIPNDQILTLAQMRAAETALMGAGTSVDVLMQRAGRGAADYVWRIAAGRAVTVLCGPGNNGGDGYVLAEALRMRGGDVRVIAAEPPRSDAARTAAALYSGAVLGPDATPSGDVLVDCLFGSGFSGALSEVHAALIARLAAAHPHRIAVDLPSGVGTDSGEVLAKDVPEYDLTIALGAWKPAHVLMPAAARMGALRLVDIGVARQARAGQMLRRPSGISAPAADAHKYSRGLLAVAAGQMPGAGMLAARAGQGAGAGYVKLVAERGMPAPADLVVAGDDVLEDDRISAMLAGPGLGRDAAGLARVTKVLRAAFEHRSALVLDADALMMLRPAMLVGRAGMISEHLGPAVATPHEGELVALEAAFGLKKVGSKIDRALALAEASGLVIVAKGPDTIIAAPEGHWLAAPRGVSWLSTAGSGDVLAGCVASRLACGAPAFAAAAQGVWLQAEAARLAGPAFSAATLAAMVPQALRNCL